MACGQRPKNAVRVRKRQPDGERERACQSHSAEVHKRREQKYIAAARADATQKVARSPRSDRSQAEHRWEIGNGDGHGNFEISTEVKAGGSWPEIQACRSCVLSVG